MSFYNVKVNSESPPNNYVSYNKFYFSEIPKISISKYFFESTENIYFLALAMFQLITYEKIGILPTYWSPSGPFSTMIPLLLCYLLEVVNLLITYFTDLYKTYKYNYYQYAKIIKDDTIELTRIKDIKTGDIIIINTDEIVPVDTILINVDGNEYGEISLSNLNGESDILCKDPILYSYEYNNNLNISIDKIKDYSNSIKNFNSECVVNNDVFTLDNNNFIPGGSLNKGGVITLIVTQVGKSIRSYTSNKNEKLFKQNFIDNYITVSLTKYFIILLGLFTISITIQKNTNFNLFNMIKTFVQSWILLNGVVPFSAKIIIMMNRGLQSYIYSTKKVEYINPNSIDNFIDIKKVICDKTGTITKNKLTLTHLSYDKKIIDKLQDKIFLPFNLISKIVLSLHYKKNSIYATEEDRVISDKLVSFGTIIEQNRNIVSIKNKFLNIEVEIIEMDKLQFDCNRKMSSVIYKHDNRHYIVTKGSLSAIENIIDDESEDFKKEKELYNKNYPHLRTLAIAYKEIDYKDTICPYEYEENGSYTFLTILGIQDDLQDQIEDTISFLEYHKKSISMCTGDRYETAINISKKIGILKNVITFDNINNITDLSNSTFVFSSVDIARALKNNNYMDKFTYLLIKSYNFVSFAMIPKDKQFVSNLFEMHGINVISVGDGNNDIPMLKCATVGIGVKNGLNSNVVNNSQITISSFSDLVKVEKDSDFCLNHNYNSIYSVFYKIILIHSLVYLFIRDNGYNLNNVLFNFIDIQGNHLLWGIIPVVVSNFKYYNTIVIDRADIIKISLLIAAINSFIIMKIKDYIVLDISEKKMILLLSILSINFKFMFIFGLRNLNIISCFISIIIGMYYVFYF